MVRGSLLFAVSLMVGCGGGEGALVPVTGVVKYADDSPVSFESGMVVFSPTGGQHSASGGVEKDGTFTMMTRKPGDGVEPGTYKVVLQLWKNYRTSEPAVPKQYADGSTTPLEVTIAPGQEPLEFKVEK